jgi:hypothetical protein
MISREEEVTFMTSVGIDTVKEDVFLTNNIKEASMTHFQCVEILEKLLKTHPLYPAEEIIDRFKFSFQVAEAIKIMGVNDL